MTLPETSLVATILHPSGESCTCVLPHSADARLSKLQEVVGGSIEVVPLLGKRYLVINEDGKMSAHRPNDFATWLAHESESITPEDYIAGVAVVVSSQVLS